MVLDTLSELLRSRLWLGLSIEPAAVPNIDNAFFGINVAPSKDPRSDSYTLDCLRELNIRNVRMDYSYESPGGDAERLLKQLLAADIAVLLNLFPAAQQASELPDSEPAQRQWQTFVGDVLAQYQGQVAIFEIGNTPNRGRWSGFSHRGFLLAWQLASEQASAFEVVLAGPNVSDFEPLYNIALLAAMARAGGAPDIHTDNLFVERVIEPESFDHRVLGRALEKPLQFNLIKKIRVLDAIGKRFGAERFICSYTCWTTKRLARWAVDPQQKKVDYLLRYIVLAATSGAMERLYWGPLVSNRDGLIDCGGEGYPLIDNVSYYKEIIGSVDDFQKHPAYYALWHLIAKLSGSVCLQGVSADNGVNHFVFEQENREYHIVWCRDGQSERLDCLYPSWNAERMSAVEITGSTGKTLNYRPQVFSEQPLFLAMDSRQSDVRPCRETIIALQPSGNVVQSISGQQCVPVHTPQWRGALVLNNGNDLDALCAELLPESVAQKTVNKVLRDTRNKLWTVAASEITDGLDRAETEPLGQLTIKLNRAKGIKKFTYRFVDSKGKRHWDNASAMLRCGVQTPAPVAYFERYNNSGIEENYYLCRYIANAFSARDVFAALNRGEASYRGLDRDQWFSQLAAFICNMHNQRIIHRDLSSGNLMITMDEHGTAEFYMIDIGRAQMGFNQRLSPRQRFIDLMRICYKLDWADRQRFIEQYNNHFGAVVSRWWRLPLYFYEAKQRLKKSLKGWLKAKAKTAQPSAGPSDLSGVTAKKTGDKRNPEV